MTVERTATESCACGATLVVACEWSSELGRLLTDWRREHQCDRRDERPPLSVSVSYNP